MIAKEFVIKYLPLAQAAAAKFGFSDPYFLLAQQYAENSGDSSLLDKTHNVGSLISRVGKNKLQTNQYWKGEEYLAKSSGLSFRVYSTLQDGYYDYARLLGNVYKLNTAKTIEEYAIKVSQSRYIDEKNGDNRELYAKNIIATYKKIKPV